MESLHFAKEPSDSFVHNFNVFPYGRNVHDYDFDSIMHYSSNAFAVDKSLPTITKKDGSTFKANRSGLSAIDRRGFGEVYGPQRSGLGEHHRLCATLQSQDEPDAEAAGQPSGAEPMLPKVELGRIRILAGVDADVYTLTFQSPFPEPPIVFIDTMTDRTNGFARPQLLSVNEERATFRIDTMRGAHQRDDINYIAASPGAYSLHHDGTTLVVRAGEASLTTLVQPVASGHEGIEAVNGPEERGPRAQFLGGGVLRHHERHEQSSSARPIASSMCLIQTQLPNPVGSVPDFFISSGMRVFTLMAVSCFASTLGGSRAAGALGAAGTMEGAGTITTGCGAGFGGACVGGDAHAATHARSNPQPEIPVLAGASCRTPDFTLAGTPAPPPVIFPRMWERLFGKCGQRDFEIELAPCAGPATTERHLPHLRQTAVFMSITTLPVLGGGRLAYALSSTSRPKRASSPSRCRRRARRAAPVRRWALTGFSCARRTHLSIG